MSGAHNLYRLQEIDLEIDEIHARLSEIQQTMEDDEEVREAQTKLEDAIKQQDLTRASLQSEEGAVSAQKYKLEQTESKLYSGSVTNPRELQDLQMESESLKRHLSTLEDRLLDAMVAHEEAVENVESSRTHIDTLLDQRKDQFAELENERDGLDEHLLRLEGNREAAVVGIMEDDLERYRALRLRYSGRAVALLEGGNCALCGLSLPESTQQRIRSGVEIVQCGQCKRILYAR
jgi:predicted  nucleic acid-binding Zn-ribbon protein